MLLLFIISTLVVKVTSLSIKCQVMGIKEVHCLPVASNVLDAHLIRSLCHILSGMFEFGELQTIVPIEHLANVEVTDEMILDFIPRNLILKDTGVTTLSHVYHSNSKLEKLFNDFLVKSNEDSAASKKRFDVITEELAVSKKRFDEYVDKSNADSAASIKRFDVITEELAVSKEELAVSKGNYTAVHKILVGLVSERGTCQVIDNVYAAILSELKRTGQYENYDDLSSLLSSRSIDETTKIAAITTALSAISGFPSASRYWIALRAVKVTRNERQHADIGSQEEAFEIVNDFLTPTIEKALTGKKAWPLSPASDLKSLLLKMIPLMYKKAL